MKSKLEKIYEQQDKLDAMMEDRRSELFDLKQKMKKLESELKALESHYNDLEIEVDEELGI